MSNKYVVANWKMNVPPEGIGGYVDALENAPAGDAQLVVAPPFIYIPEVVKKARRVAVSSQNCGDQKSGAFTGEVSAAMLRDSGAWFAIVGHSERRNLYKETDELVARRMAMAMENGLTAVFCIGEDLTVRDSGIGNVTEHLANQIRAAAQAADSNPGGVIVAYEPIWAIGTGRNASGTMVAETVAAVRDAVRQFWPASRSGTSILYGGSVTPDNVGDLVANGNIDGFLVGGASLDSRKFLAIYDGLVGRLARP
jgi:triosephosphate isomerase (TIM)